MYIFLFVQQYMFSRSYTNIYIYVPQTRTVLIIYDNSGILLTIYVHTRVHGIILYNFVRRKRTNLIKQKIYIYYVSEEMKYQRFIDSTYFSLSLSLSTHIYIYIRCVQRTRSIIIIIITCILFMYKYTFIYVNNAVKRYPSGLKRECVCVFVCAHTGSKRYN